MMGYVNKFNHLAQYAASQVDTDDKKKDRFFRGLAPLLQEKLYTANSDLRGTNERRHCHGGFSAGVPGRVEEEAGGSWIF